MFPAAVSFITYFTLVPKDHPFYSKKLNAFMSHKMWQLPANYSGFIYTLHLPLVMVYVLKMVGEPNQTNVNWSTVWKMLTFGVIMAAILGKIFKITLENPINQLRRKIKVKTNVSAAIKEKLAKKKS